MSNKARASIAIASVSAHTQATKSPICRTFSTDIACSSLVTGRTPNRFGASCPVATDITPGNASTLVVSMDIILA